VLKSASLTFAIIGRRYTSGDESFLPYIACVNTASCCQSASSTVHLYIVYTLAVPAIMRSLLGFRSSCTLAFPWFKMRPVAPDLPDTIFLYSQSIRCKQRETIGENIYLNLYPSRFGEGERGPLTFTPATILSIGTPLESLNMERRCG
jgi:hypothetical protein